MPWPGPPPYAFAGRLASLPNVCMSSSTSAVAYHTCEVGHSGEPGHRLSVFAEKVQQHALAFLDGVAVVAPGDGEAGGQALDVPLPWPGKGLVEVVDAEDQPPFRRREHTEVQEVGIAADLHGDPGPRRAGEVVGHQQRRTSIERERRHQHPAVADRHQLWHPRDALGSRARLDGIVSIGAWHEAGVARSGHLPRAALPRAARSVAVRWGTTLPCSTCIPGGYGLAVRWLLTS